MPFSAIQDNIENALVMQNVDSNAVMEPCFDGQAGRGGCEQQGPEAAGTGDALRHPETLG